MSNYSGSLVTDMIWSVKRKRRIEHPDITTCNQMENYIDVTRIEHIKHNIYLV